MVQLLAIQIVPTGTEESQITAVRWYNPEDGQINVATTDVMIHFLSQQGGLAYIYNGRDRADVTVAPGARPYLTTRPTPFPQTQVSLLNLPRF